MTNIFAQSDFFYSENGKKEIFKIRKDLVVFKMKSHDIQEKNIQKSRFKSLDTMVGNLMIAKVDPNEFKDEELYSSGITDDSYYMLEYNEGALLALCNNIFIKPSKGESIERIVQKCGLSGKIKKNELFLPESGIFLLTLDCKMKDILSICRNIYETGMVDFVEPDIFMESMVGNTLFPQQWNLKNTGQENGTPGIDINIQPAWNITKGNSSIKIAIVDEGVDLTHPDLRDNLLTGYDATGNGTNGGYTGNDVHGTSCAGVIGAIDNSFGVVGVAPRCKMIPIKSFGEGGGSSSHIIAGINHARLAGADVINNSWGSSAYTSTVYKAVINECVNLGRNGKGCVLVFCSHNNGGAVYNPANFPNVLAVGSVTSVGRRVSSSNYGNELNVVAPVGECSGSTTKVYTTDLQGSKGRNTASGTAGDYRSDFCGTSAACPQVAGIAALILSVNPNLYEYEVRNIIEMTCKKLNYYVFQTTSAHPNGSWNNEVGYGLVDAQAAVQAATCINSLANNISSNKFARSCSTRFTLQNVAVSNNANLTVKSTEMSVSGTFQVNSGSFFEIR